MVKASRVLGAAAERPLVRRLLRPVVTFGVIAVAGVVGFVVLAGIGPVNASFWLLDPTSIELYFQHHGGPARLVKAYAIVILVGLILAGLWAGETAVSAAFGGQISEELTHMQLQQQVDDLDDHVVVCGYGTFGKTVAAGLEAEEQSVVVVECQQAQYEQAIEDGHLAIEGDAREQSILGEAGVERAATVVGAVDDTNVNTQITVTATQLAPTVSVVVRAGDQMDEALARRVGADEVIVPEVLSGKQVSATLSE
ncbi:NAD(P)-binding protein [Halapricum salinum]|uniref:Potassium channel protein n=1 Tax=Halapricum salinum TaxID=1457250 RepID=A0A4D6HDX1_9EURY|nr:NAD(P)-binding protein [Halapricum salinum]QCC51368.1 potassium channel protein [Halapricum salinum]